MPVLTTIEELQGKIKTNPFHPAPYIRLASYYLKEGNDEEARRIILKRCQMPNQ